MKETFAAIIGALIAGVITWLISKRRPAYIECKTLYLGTLEALPGTKYSVKDSVIDSFGIARVRFKNLGSMVITSPTITLKLKDNVEIYNAIDNWYHGDKRVSNDHPVKRQEGKIEKPLLSNVEIYSNVITIKIDALYPNQLNDEYIVLDIFTDNEVTEIDVDGQGVMSDGSCWAVKYLTDDYSAWKDPIRVVSRVYMLLLFLITVIYSVKRRPWSAISVNNMATTQLMQDQWAWFVVILFFLGCCWLIYLLEVGRYIYLPLPLLNREIRLYLKKGGQ